MGQVVGLAGVALAPERRRTERAFESAALAGIGVFASALTIGFLVHSPVLVNPTWTGILRGLFVLAYAAAGAYTWWRRPASLVGPLIAGMGFLFAFTSLNGSGNADVYTLGMTVWAAFTVFLAYVYLCFPRSRPHSHVEAAFVGVYALIVTVTWTASLVFADRLPRGGTFTDCGNACPPNGFQLVETSNAVSTALDRAWSIGSAFGLLGIGYLIVRKTRAPDRLRRRVVEPLGWAFLATVVFYLAYLFVGYGHPDTKPALRAALAVLQLSIPAAMVIGQIRGQMFAATSVGTLAATMLDRPVTPGAVEALVRDALGDPTVQLAFPAAGAVGLVGIDGEAVSLPAPHSGRVATPVVQHGRTVAVFIHDDALDTDAAIVEGLAATSLMLLQNAELVSGLRASRERIVTASERERLRLERDLHDGAQQRLMAIQIKLALLRDELDEGELAAKLDEIGEDATAAVDELRGLAHGIYPTVLRERGLDAALRSLARTTPIRLDVVDRGVGRCDPTVEAAIYFCVAEAIQNATKHAGLEATVTVMLGRDEDGIDFSVVDDGVGFEPDDNPGGIGFLSMRDRIEAIGGRLTIGSVPGHGTSIGGTVPLADPTP